jgi:hypothetical protein
MLVGRRRFRCVLLQSMHAFTLIRERATYNA